MSLATWKREFYRVPAGKVPKLRALAHSIRKWEGLTKANLRKHGCEGFGSNVVERGHYEGLHVNQHSCALCVHYYSEDVGCAACPLACLRGNVSCDEPVPGENMGVGGGCPEAVSPYTAWTLYRDVRPMLRLLRGAARRGIL